MSMIDNPNPAVRRQLINELARVDLNTFAKVVFEILYGNKELQNADYLAVLGAKVQGAITRRGSRLIINLPPRYLKSHIAVISAVAWAIGRNPRLQIMIACHTDRLVQTHLNAIRRVLKSERFIEIFGAVIGGKDTEAEVETVQGGRIIAVSFQSAPTGIGCDILIIDDPLQAHDANNLEAQERCFEFYQDSLLSRLNPQGMGVVVLAMQRLSRGDLAGRLLEFGTYEQLSLPMIATEPEAIDLEGPLGPIRYRREPGQPLNPNMDFEAWKKEHPEIPEFTFATQYQQNPQVPGGAMIKKEWLEPGYSLEGVFQDQEGFVVQSWDTATSLAASASYSTCLTLYASKRRFVVLDCFRVRCEAAQLMDHALQLAARYKPRRVLVEKANIGPAIGGVLQRAGFQVVEISSSQTKLQRLESCIAAFQQLMVVLPTNAPWLAAYKDELLSFPGSRFSDQVDATTQFLNWIWPYVAGLNEDKTLWGKKLVARALQTGPTYARVGRGLERFDPSDHAPYRPTRGPRWRR